MYVSFYLKEYNTPDEEEEEEELLKAASSLAR